MFFFLNISPIALKRYFVKTCCKDFVIKLSKGSFSNITIFKKCFKG